MLNVGDLVQSSDFCRRFPHKGVTSRVTSAKILVDWGERVNGIRWVLKSKLSAQFDLL